MIYMIGQNLIWLIITAAFAAAAGWAFLAWRNEPARQALRRERERLVQDLAQLAAGDGPAPEPGVDAADSLAHIRESRIAELERALESARARANDAAGEAAELRRALERQTGDDEELMRLRALVAEHETQRSREIEVAAADQVDAADPEDGALQAWRLRYFEQRVRYLEERPPPEPAREPSPPPVVDMQQIEWRAREAEARAAYLEQELRALAAAPAREEAEPFAADAGLDALLRWRTLYLERRVAYLQQADTDAPETVAAVAAAAPQPAPEAAPDPDRWKWRARYLEARVRHLEQRAPPPAAAPSLAAAAPVAAAPSEPEREAPPRPQRAGVKPPVLASARNGAPDDLTLIDGVSLLQQSTLNALGVFHFDQIAGWSPDNVAWVDAYLRLRGRIDDEEWVEQAHDLALEGPSAARRAFESEPAPL